MTGSPARYGSWKSPIGADLVAAASVRLGEIALDGGDVYWVEGRPAERGRNVVVHRSADGQTRDVTPAPYNVRTRANEYGGGAFTVDEGIVYFANFADGRLYRQLPGGEPTPLTPEGGYCYADIIVDRARNRLICVREDHTVLESGAKEVENTLVSVPIPPVPPSPRGKGGANDRDTVPPPPSAEGLGEGSAPIVLARSLDFYSNPRLSPDGSRLAFLGWRHPNMPWDASELWVADLEPDGSLDNTRLVAGGRNESIFQPEWSPNGTLHFVSDRSGWWNLYRWNGRGADPLCPIDAEFGRPQWVFGLSTYAFASDNTIVCSYAEAGSWKLGLLDAGNRLTTFDLPYTEINAVHATSDKAVFSAGSPTTPTAIVSVPLSTRERGLGGEVRSVATIKRASDTAIDSGYLSVPEAIEFPTEGGLTAHAFFYPPKNRDFAGPNDERPPLLVLSHGGPTSATSAVQRLSVQFWTSRGIAVLDVNYGGSTGYGREYRERLNGKWGVVDVDDCVNGARYLVSRGRVDGSRLAISGGSAGGYTTLCALTFRDVFRAGASYYGVSDLEGLELDTHKFEARYTHGLVAPYPAARDLYLERSPLHHADRLLCPVIFFQGLDDKVVPPNQTERMVEALRSNRVPVAYVSFEGEQHGFRQAANIRRALEAELYFYSRVFGFPLADPIEPVTIENLD